MGLTGFPGSGHHEPASLRQRKKTATRRALRSAATRLIGERGLAEVTVEDIAAAAGVSARTFFNYFASKEDAVVGWDPDLAAELMDALVARPAGDDPLDALSHVLVETFGGFDADPREVLDRLSVIRAEPHLLARHAAGWVEVERQLVAALEQRGGGEAPAGDHLALVVATALAACRVAVMSWCERDGQTHVAELVAENLREISAGLARPVPDAPTGWTRGGGSR